MAKPSKSKKKSRKHASPGDIQRAKLVAAGLEASFTVPPPPAAMAPAPLLDEIRELGPAGIQGMAEHLASTSPAGRAPTLAALRELGEAEAVPSLLVHARALRWAPEDLAALGETIRALDPKAELPEEMEAGALERTKRALARLREDLTPEKAGEVCEIIRDLPARLREVALRGITAEGAARPASLLALAGAMAGRKLPPSPPLIDAIATLETREAAQALAGLAEEAPDKETSSRLRKALYRLRNRGIEVEAAGPAPGAPAPASAPGVDYAVARISAVDGMGRMMVWVVRSIAPRGRFVAEAMLRRGLGVEDFATADMGAKELREVFARITDPAAHLATCEVPLGYAIWLLQRAQREAEQGGQSLPPGFTRGKLLLEPLADPQAFPPGEAHPVRRLLQPPAQGEARMETHELFQDKVFWSWLIEDRRILPHLRALVDSLQSKVVVEEPQRRERLEQIVSEAARALYGDEALRARTGGALEDNAYFFHASGQPALARECLALVGEMRAGGEPPAFFREMVRLSLSVMLDRLARQSQAAAAPAGPEQASAGEGRIVTP
ncbi:MAG: hypothetical protein AABZ64_09960 [Nitrospinota bacterium]